MSNQQPPKKKVVVTKKKKVETKDPVPKTTVSKKKVSTKAKPKSKAPVRSKAKSKSKKAAAANNAYRSELIIGRTQLILMGVGLAIVFIGLALMTGGSMDDPNVWDEDVIYSPRRLTLAPMLILLGMGIEIYALFKKN